MTSRRTDMKVERNQGDQCVRTYGFPDVIHTQSGAASPDTESHGIASASTPDHRASTSYSSGGINTAMHSSAHVLGSTSSPGHTLGATPPPGQVLGATPPSGPVLGATPPPRQTPALFSPPVPVHHPVSRDEDHDIPGQHQILDSHEPVSETDAALKKLKDAPSISSLLPPQTSSSEEKMKKYNIAVSSVGCESLSTAQALLQQSLDSGSLIGAAVKLQDANTNPPTGISVLEDKQMESKMPNSSYAENSIESEEMVTSYVGMALSDNSERFAHLDSELPTEKQNKSSLSPNNLGLGGQGRQWQTADSDLPNNISQQSNSLNEDLSLTARKTVTKSTQTDPPAGQDQEGCGGAASAELGVQTMAYGSSSSLPPEDILVRKLKRPIIQWLQRKLETQIGAAWQELVDLHDWDNDRITDFENHCASFRKSPFSMLLAESEFQMYRLCDLKKDLLKLPRKDVLHDLDGVMNKHYK